MTKFTKANSFYRETIESLTRVVKILESIPVRDIQFGFYKSYISGAHSTDKDIEARTRARIATCLIQAGTNKTTVKDALNVVQGGYRSSAN